MITALARKTQHTTTNGTILVVEDDTDNMAIMCDHLERAGYAVDPAPDGAIALRKLLHNNDYVMVITDRMMPSMDGLQLVKAMKKNTQLAHIPVIMQTGANAPEQIAEGIRSGVYYYLAKPYLEETLTTLVSTVMRERKQKGFFNDRHEMYNQALGTFCYGKFELSTLEEAQNVALMLGGLFPQPELGALGLYELIVNAIEHGNLGIGYDEKARLLATDEWESEVTRRQALPENAAKRVDVIYTRSDSKLHVTITDKGEGFNWRPYMEIEPSRATQGNGRGIAKANLLCFDSVTYQGNGNSVHVTKNIVQ